MMEIILFEGQRAFSIQETQSGGVCRPHCARNHGRCSFSECQRPYFLCWRVSAVNQYPYLRCVSVAVFVCCGCLAGMQWGAGRAGAAGMDMQLLSGCLYSLGFCINENRFWIYVTAKFIEYYTWLVSRNANTYVGTFISLHSSPTESTRAWSKIISRVRQKLEHKFATQKGLVIHSNKVLNSRII